LKSQPNEAEASIWRPVAYSDQDAVLNRLADQLSPSCDVGLTARPTGSIRSAKFFSSLSLTGILKASRKGSRRRLEAVNKAKAGIMVGDHSRLLVVGLNASFTAPHRGQFCHRRGQLPGNFEHLVASSGLRIPNLKALLSKVRSLHLSAADMTSAVSLLPGQVSNGSLALPLPSEVALRRAGQRRQTLFVQAISYSLVTLVLLIYCYVGTIPAIIPEAYFLCGMALLGFFLGLSETRVNDRFEDHYLSFFQVGANVTLQLAFLLAAPQIGYAFLSVVFLIFGFGALRMTSRQATIAWSVTVIGLVLAFMLTTTPIGMPFGTPVERFAAILCYVIVIGQCAFVGLYGSSLRKKLHSRNFELREAYRRIEELAELDDLTGSFNRRCIMRMLDERITHAKRSKMPCSIALIDLDWFKRINDAYGHPIGDEVLRTFAITVFANIRTIDRFGRYGGEEFLLVLPDTPIDGAARILERLRTIVAELDWSAFSPGLRVTISAGIATLRSDETPDTFLARADSALYTAKARGRDRIASA
jgi:diguanylate cyclase (GGDEF)-like protein